MSKSIQVPKIIHFPDSPRAAALCGIDKTSINRTIAEGVERWMEVQTAKKATSTSRNYGHKANHVPKWAGQEAGTAMVRRQGGVGIQGSEREKPGAPGGIDRPRSRLPAPTVR